MYLAVTCSPTKGVDETLELSEKLIGKGFKVTPHIASKCVSGEKHLEIIIKKLDELGIDSILFLAEIGLSQWEISVMPQIF